MPRTENDKRTPYVKATGRRVTRGLDLVSKLRVELNQIEGALTSGQYIYHSSLAEQAARLSATMAELEALEEMNEDQQAVETIEAGTARTGLTEDQWGVMGGLAQGGGRYESKKSDWIYTSPTRTRQVFDELAGLGLVAVHKGENRLDYLVLITDAGREAAKNL